MKKTYNQAYVPEKCIVIQNLTGTAPCTWFEKDGKVLVSMPGVPYEMKSLMENEIIVRLKACCRYHPFKDNGKAFFRIIFNISNDRAAG